MNEKTLKFIEKAKTIHGNKYDYSLVNYTKSKNKIKIICPIHGEFKQSANGHLKGYNCSKCSFDKQKLNVVEFIKRAEEIHNNKYNYSLVDYKSYDENIKIICPEHGEFEQTPNNHLKGGNCLKCSFIFRKTNVIRFIKKSTQKHNNKYDYSLTNYNGFDKKVKIICPDHGEFEQTPQNHLKGQGCPICKESNGEKKIREFLIEDCIKYIQQKKFKDCKYKISLPFDFYLPDYNICIEYNGIQHYKPIQHFGGVKVFEEQKLKDKIKSEYCSKNGIKLIIIKYNENIDKIKIILKANKND